MGHVSTTIIMLKLRTQFSTQLTWDTTPNLLRVPTITKSITFQAPTHYFPAWITSCTRVAPVHQ
jgi:hypothetical protein